MGFQAWSASLWQTFFALAVGAQISAIARFAAHD